MSLRLNQSNPRLDRDAALRLTFPDPSLNFALYVSIVPVASSVIFITLSPECRRWARGYCVSWRRHRHAALLLVEQGDPLSVLGRRHVGKADAANGQEKHPDIALGFGEELLDLGKLVGVDLRLSSSLPRRPSSSLEAARPSASLSVYLCR